MPMVQTRPLATLDTGFDQRLATRQAPTFLGPLGHHVAPEAPHGRVAAASTSRQPVTFPSAPPVQRQVMTYARPPETPSPPTVAATTAPPEPTVPVTPADIEAAPVPTAEPRVPDGPAIVRAAPVVSRLVTARPPADLPAVTFPVVARLPAADAPPAGDAGESSSDAGESSSEDIAEAPVVVSEAPPPTGAADATVASLVGDKPPMTSLPEPDAPAPSVAPSPEASPAPAGRTVQRQSRPGAAHSPTGTTASSGSPSHADASAKPGTGASPLAKSSKSPVASQPPTVARTLDPTGTPRPRVTPRIGPPIQRTADDASPSAPVDGGTPPPMPDLGVSTPPSPSEPSEAPVPAEVHAAEVHAAEAPPEAPIQSVPLVGDRGLSGAPTFATVPASPGPSVARSHLPGGAAAAATSPPAGPAVTAQRAVTWRPRVAEPFAPVQVGSTPPAVPPSVAGRPTVSRHAEGGSGHHHPADEWPEVSTLAVSRLAEGPSTRVLASPSVARAPESDAGTATRQETTVAGIRWSDRPAPVAQSWTAAAVQRATPRTPSGAPSSRTPTASIPQLLMQNERSVRSPSRVEEQVWWELPGAADVVQRQADDAPETAEAAPAPTPTTVTATAETGPAAPAGGAGGGRKAPTEAEADEWARALYPALRRRICRDLMLDRERSGYSTDIRY